MDFIGQLSQRNHQIYNRQLVYIWANHNRHLPEALNLALAELEIRKDTMGWDAAAWAYYKNGSYAEAEKAMQQALKYQVQNALLYYHAGLIAEALDHPQAARQYLTQALSLNPHFDPLQTQQAAAVLARLKDPTEEGQDPILKSKGSSSYPKDPNR